MCRAFFNAKKESEVRKYNGKKENTYRCVLELREYLTSTNE